MGAVWRRRPCGGRPGSTETAECTIRDRELPVRSDGRLGVNLQAGRLHRATPKRGHQSGRASRQKALASILPLPRVLGGGVPSRFPLPVQPQGQVAGPWSAVFPRAGRGRAEPPLRGRLARSIHRHHHRHRLIDVNSSTRRARGSAGSRGCQRRRPSPSTLRSCPRHGQKDRKGLSTDPTGTYDGCLPVDGQGPPPAMYRRAPARRMLI